tara:strand:- start:302 stop:508 length:207 start_codon:yes stop_codon:yes gene_type:complete
MPNAIFAAIDDDNVCTGLTEYYTPVTPDANMVELLTFDISVVGMVWDADGAVWVDNPNPPDPPDPPPE